MKQRYQTDYDQRVDCFEQIKNVQSDLIWGKQDADERPFISYVIPVYKRADMLEKTLFSVLRQKPVDFKWNVVVVDNEAGGENDTERLIKRINDDRILYYRNRENIGVDGNYNRCIELADGKWVAMVHGDDLLVSDHLRKSGQYIERIEKKRFRKPLAYICQQYIDFRDDAEAVLDRPDKLDYTVKNNAALLHGHKDKIPALQPQNIGILTGYYAAIPSFGTIMNREILIREGGFNEKLGICEDIIIPFKLAARYSVYMSPVVMGYHRFDENESMKLSTILKIYSAMIDFREYMYSTVWWGKWWAEISRSIFTENLQNYCIGQSRFSERRLSRGELDEICGIGEQTEYKQLLFNICIWGVNKFYKLGNYKTLINGHVSFAHDAINQAVLGNKQVVIYGIGAAAKEAIPLIKKEFKKINIIGCAVTEKGKRDKFCGLVVKAIDEYDVGNTNIAVITATITWQYQFEMNKYLESQGCKTVINLM